MSGESQGGYSGQLGCIVEKSEKIALELPFEKAVPVLALARAYRHLERELSALRAENRDARRALKIQDEMPIPKQVGAIGVWPFEDAPVRLEQMAPSGQPSPSWVLIYQREDGVTRLNELRLALSTAPHSFHQRSLGRRIVEFLW